jgi:hypothetical protein
MSSKEKEWATQPTSTHKKSLQTQTKQPSVITLKDYSGPKIEKCSERGRDGGQRGKGPAAATAVRVDY